MKNPAQHAHPAPQPTAGMLQVYDVDGYPNKALTRAEIQAEPRIHWCAVANIWLIGPDGSVLCPQRSEKDKDNPGKWQSCFGGHVKCGHTFREAAMAELQEEIGLAMDPSRLFLVEKGSDAENLTHFAFYIYPFGGKTEDLKFVDGEIAAVRWLTLENCRQEQDGHPGEWCNGIPVRLEPAIRSWIAGRRGRGGR